MAQRARIPRGTLNREAIVTAAVEVLADGGLDALTMRAVADALGTRSMSLYTYFSGKEQLLTAAEEHLIAMLDLPEPGSGGVEALREIFRAYWRMLVAHPWLVRRDHSREETSPGDLRLAETIYSIVGRLGIPERTAVGLVATTFRFTLGCATLYPGRRAWDDPRHWERLRTELGKLPRDDYPSLHLFSTELSDYTQDEVFEFGLNELMNRFRAAAEHSS
ncbi:hypothetical protein Ssi02_40450 [Sinosporangium siamense]|uniref:HTH tetR-type domain-containing protein n=2 Tax=Sinosporangium siamense TaxID=1367973 RepID=A0A919VD63_9ACTN|nr:hypothetical protein Ssi02_40450 [Sinosporangium siamense]